MGSGHLPESGPLCAAPIEGATSVRNCCIGLAAVVRTGILFYMMNRTWCLRPRQLNPCWQFDPSSAAPILGQQVRREM